MKPHLPSALRRALLACCALSVGFTLSSGIAVADTTLGKTDTITIDYAARTQTPLDADGVLTLTGDTKLMLLNMGDITGFSYTLCTGVSGLQTADGELTLTTGNNSAEAYFDTTAPGSSIWKDASLQWVDDKLLLVLNNTRVKDSVTITERQTGSVDYQEYKGVSFESITGGTIIGLGDSTMSNNGSVSFSNNSNNKGGAIFADWCTITMSKNGSVSFNANSADDNGGAIDVHYEGELTLSNNGSVSFLENKATADGGAIFGSDDSSITLSGNGSISFSGNISYLDGGAMTGLFGTTIELNNNSSISISENTATRNGGAIHDYESSISLNENGSVSFSKNAAGGNGGAANIESDGQFTLSSNDNVEFCENEAESGGAIYGYDSTITLSNNDFVSFSKNEAETHGGSIYVTDRSSFIVSDNGEISFSGNKAGRDGGAINGGWESNITLINNTSSVSFNGNESTYSSGGAIRGSDGTVVTISYNLDNVTFCNNKAYRDGGAMSGGYEAKLILSGNKSITFDANSAGNDGGAINGYYSTITLSSNGNVSFIGNTADACGGAIDGLLSSIILSNNNKVCFEKNVSKKDVSYRLQSIASRQSVYSSTIPQLVLSAPENGSIIFKDSIYAEGEVELNAAYDHDGDASTAPIAQSGTITFTGEQVEADLKSYLDDNNVTLSDEALAEAIRLSKTSTLNGTATLYNGTLEVKKGAILEVGKTLTVNDGATLAIIDNGQLTNSGTLTLNGKTILGSTISNSGTVKLGGTIDISGITPYETGISVRVNEFGYEGTKSGFLREGDCRIKVVNGGTIEDTGATIDYNGEVMTGVSTLANGIVQVKTQDINYREYLLENTDNATYSRIATASGGQLERISLRGGILNLDCSLDSGVTLKILGDIPQSIDMWENVVLSKGSLEELSDSRELIISGKASSVYEITGELGLGAGVSLKDWNGTVRATDTTLSSGGVDTTEWKNTELKGVTTVRQGATLTLGGNVLLCGKISNSGTLNLTGNITVDAENYAPEDAVKEVLDYYIGASALPNTKNSGFESAAWDITIAEGGVIDGSAATWTVTGIDAAGLRFDSDGTLHAYGSDVGSVFHVAAGDSIIYGSGNEADFTNSKGTEATCISLNGGTLVLNTGLRDNREDYVKSTAASTVEIGSGVELSAAQLDASAADVTLAGTGGYDLESGSALAGGVKLGSGWKGTVYTGAIAAGTESLDVNHLGNTDSTVQLGKNGDASMNSLTADAVGTVETPGALSLMNQTSQVRHLTVKGGLTLGSADAAATLIATGALSTQGITLGNIGSTASAAMLLDDTLNLTVADSELLKLTGSTTVLTLGSAYAGTTTLNGEKEVLGSNGKMIYTLVWQTPLTRAVASTSLVLQADTNPVYVQNKVGEQVKHYSYNGRAGLRILNAAYAEHNPQQNAAGGALAGLIDTVDAGKMTDEDLAAVAGASTAVLGQALSGDVERQLRAIRNRAAMGNHGTNSVAWDGKGGLVSTSLPSRYFAWVNAEGNRAEQNADGTAPGYTLNSWGGTVGAGMQVNSNLTMGLALSAMYGDLRSDGPDSLDGDMDTTYLSAFARYESGKWSHAFIGTAGTMEADYKRTVSHATDSYHTYGDTDGTAFGLMYEVSRDFTLGSKGTLSPVFNISYRHAEVDGYRESGVDTALNVGEQSLDTMTLGLGARYAAVVGERAFNRACAFEARALAKYDFGDTQNNIGVGFVNQATHANIDSAEMGAFGVELGAGISVPVGKGSIFADGAMELRSDYTNFNATVGYKIQF